MLLHLDYRSTMIQTAQILCIYRQPTGMHKEDVQDAVMHKQDCGRAT